MPRPSRGGASAGPKPANKFKQCIEALVRDPEAACLGGNDFCCAGCGGNSDLVDSLCAFCLHRWVRKGAERARSSVCAQASCEPIAALKFAICFLAFNCAAMLPGGTLQPMAGLTRCCWAHKRPWKRPRWARCRSCRCACVCWGSAKATGRGLGGQRAGKSGRCLSTWCCCVADED